MSQRYDMNVEIRNFDPSKSKAIQEAANQEWNFEDWYETNTYLQSSSEGNLSGGESDSEFSDRLTEAVWKANGAFCEVTVNSTYLEDLPCETFQRDEEDYQRFLLWAEPHHQEEAAACSHSRFGGTGSQQRPRLSLLRQHQRQPGGKRPGSSVLEVWRQVVMDEARSYLEHGNA